MGRLENSIDELLKEELDSRSLEDFLEDHDISATECVVYLYRAGLIDLALGVIMDNQNKEYTS